MQNRNRASEELAETSNEYNYYCPDKKSLERDRLLQKCSWSSI